MQSSTILITGASSGIGLELAKVSAARKHNLILVARNVQALTDLKMQLEQQYAVAVHVIQKDLSVSNAAESLYNDVKLLGLSVNALINNAGFGDFGSFADTDWQKNHQMLELNIVALTQLTHLYLNDMSLKGQGKIMNVASTAAFQPGPKMAVYAATKAYVLSFSEAIQNEYASKGISVTALCPGATESGFMAAASMEDAAIFKNKQLPTSAEVALYGYKAMMKGQAVAIHGTLNYILANAGRFVPRGLVTKIARRVIEGGLK